MCVNWEEIHLTFFVYTKKKKKKLFNWLSLQWTIVGMCYMK